MRAMLSIFFVLMVLQTPSAIAEQKTSLFTGIVIKGARGAEGAEVVEVKPGSFSDSAGLKSGDIIVQVDGAKINSLGSFAGGTNRYFVQRLFCLQNVYKYGTRFAGDYHTNTAAAIVYQLFNECNVGS